MRTAKPMVFDDIPRTRAYNPTIVVRMVDEKPYYEIMWWDVDDLSERFGYGSFDLPAVQMWFSKQFVVESEIARTSVVRYASCYTDSCGYQRCTHCDVHNGMLHYYRYCPSCGSKLLQNGGNEHE